MAEPDLGEDLPSAEAGEPAPAGESDPAPVSGEPAAPPPAAAAPPAAAPPPAGREGRARTGRSAAIGGAMGIALAALAFQNLWEHGGALLGEGGRGVSVPMLALGGMIGLVAALIVALVAVRARRLFLSVRMTVALLTAAALLCLASLPFEQEGAAGLRGAASERNEARATEVLGAVLPEGTDGRVSEKVLLLVRTARLTDIAGSWALRALLGALALGSLAGLIWRRPVGAREFGFLAAHTGVLLVLGGAAWGSLFGYRAEGVGLGTGGQPRAVGRKGAGLSLRARAIEVEDLPPVCAVFARGSESEPRERLALVGSRPGAAVRWRGLVVRVEEFLPRVTAEAYVDDQGVRLDDPAVQLEFQRPTGRGQVVVHARSPGWWADDRAALELRYQRVVTEAAALSACSLGREGSPESLQILAPGKGIVQKLDLPFGHAKVGREFLIRRPGIRLRVLRWFSGSKPAGPGGLVQCPPLPEAPPAVEFAPVPDVPSETPPAFWVVGGERPGPALGEVPAQLQGMEFLYNPKRWQPLSVRVVEGPPGDFRLAEIVDGRPVRTRRIEVGQTLALEGGGSLRLVAFLRAARRAYRPGKPREGAPLEPAVRLAVSRGAVTESFWLFPARSAPYEALGASFMVRTVPRGPRRLAVEVEVFVRGQADPSTARLEYGRPLAAAGHEIRLQGVEISGRRDGRPSGSVKLIVTRRPGQWAVYLGMVLVVLGAHWLLWSRLRRVPDPVGEET
jgi:hypothetical protein